VLRFGVPLFLLFSAWAVAANTVQLDVWWRDNLMFGKPVTDHGGASLLAGSNIQVGSFAGIPPTPGQSQPQRAIRIPITRMSQEMDSEPGPRTRSQLKNA
jgi:hypothetical protein